MLIKNFSNNPVSTEIAVEAFLKGIEAVLPENCFDKCLKLYNDKIKTDNFEIKLSQYKKINVISVGKASIGMAKALFGKIKPDNHLIVGTEKNISENYNYISAGHPIPDKMSWKAGEELLNLVEIITEKDLTFFLISGGASALIERSFIPLERLIEINRMLLKSGANIYEINCVRKHLSEIKGGNILKKIKGDVVSLIISDVIGDSLETIASGMTYFDTSTMKDAVLIAKKYNLPINPSEFKETLKQDEFKKLNVKNFIIANNNKACNSVISYLKSKKINIFYIGSQIQGEAKEVAKVLGGICKELTCKNIGLEKPVALVSGGEPTVTVRGKGKGGRNQELCLAMFPFIKEIGGSFLSCGTDGIDGFTDAAGAVVDNLTVENSDKMLLNYEEFLLNNDSNSFFEKTGNLIKTGKTGTNVADIQIFIKIC